jgi:flagellar hook-length control protein FliK
MNVLNISNGSSLNLAVNNTPEPDIGDNSFKKELDSNLKEKEKAKDISNTVEEGKDDAVILSHPTQSESNDQNSVRQEVEVQVGDGKQSENAQPKVLETASEQISEQIDVRVPVEVTGSLIPSAAPVNAAPVNVAPVGLQQNVKPELTNSAPVNTAAVSVAPLGVSLNGQPGFTNVSGVTQDHASLSAAMNSSNRTKPSNPNVSLVQRVMAYVKEGSEEKLSTNNGFATMAGISDAAEASELKPIVRDVQAKETTTPTPQLSKLAMEKVKSSAWAKQVANRALMMTQYGPRSIEINLDPPELGALQIRVHITASEQVSIAFNAQNQAVKDSIAENFDSLKDLFEDEGLDLAEASVNDDQNKEASKVSWLDENGDVKDNLSSESKNKEKPKTKLGIVDVYA